MRKTMLSILLVALLGTCLPTKAQRHVKRISAWGLHYGLTEQGKYYEVTYLNYLTDKLAVRAGALREFGNMPGKSEHAAFTVRVFLSPQLFSLGEIAYVHALLGAAASHERAGAKGAGETPEANKPQRFTYGPQIGAEADIYFSNRVSLVATATKGRQLNNTLINSWPGYVGLGLHYHFH